MSLTVRKFSSLGNGPLLFLAFVLSCSLPQLPAAEPITFDVPHSIAVESLEHPSYTPSLPGNRLVSMRVRVSSFVPTSTSQSLGELVYRISSPARSMRVVDYWPRTEMTSSVDGVMQVQEQSEQSRQFAFVAAGGTPGVGGGNANGSLDRRQHQSTTYAKKAPKQLLSASGTIDRGYGVYYKLKPGVDRTLEGERDFWILWEVPAAWRADLMEISMQGLREASSSKSQESLGATRNLVAIYQSQDALAYGQAQQYVQHEQSLRRIAAIHSEEIRRRSQPTFLHEIGQQLDLVSPEISESWLEEVLFQVGDRYIDRSLQKLPVDVRVAVLDYIDHRVALRELSRGNERNSQALASKPTQQSSRRSYVNYEVARGR